MKKSLKALAVLSLLLSGCAQPAADEESGMEELRYYSLLEELSGKGGRIDYTELRLAYTETPMYDPYGVDENKEKMQEYHRLGELSKAVQYANEVLKKNFVDIDAHLNLTMIYDKLGETKKKEYHQYVFSSLIHLIKNSGDGESRETAYKVISVREEYNFLDAMGLKASSQGYLENEGRYYDRIEAVDRRSGEEKTVYFDVTIPQSWLADNIGNFLR